MSKECITNSIVKTIFKNVQGKPKMVHKALCELGGINPDTIIVGSIYNKAKRIVHLIQRLKNCKNETRLNNYLDENFTFPRRILKRKQSESVDELNNTVKKLKTDIENQNRTNLKLREKMKEINLSRLNQKIKRLNSTIVRQQNLMKELRIKIKNLEKGRPSTGEKNTQCNITKKMIDDLKDEINILNYEKEINDENNNKTEIIATRNDTTGRPYNEKIRQIYYEFRSRGIGLQHIAPLIKSVLKLFDMEIDELPSESTAANFTNEMCYITKQQIGEVFENNENLTLHRDATTKSGRHFYGLTVTNENKENYVTGIKEIKDGKAATYAECTSSVLKDVSASINNNNLKPLQKITSFMTDRSATENKTNEILTTEAASYSDHTIEPFKCAVHPLLQFSEICEKELIKIEHETGVNVDQKKESTTLCSLKFVSKLFFKDGSGDPLLTKVYLKNHHSITDIPIINFRGNRFNTLFYNARGTFYLAKFILLYLESSKNSLNFTQKYIFDSLKNEKIIALFRALGIICYAITEPYLKIAADNQISAIQMTPIYTRLITLLETCIEDPKLLFNNSTTLSDEPPTLPIKPENSCLFSSDHEPLTEMALKRFCVVLLEKSRHLFRDFLTGGKYDNASETITEKTLCCPPNNISVERVFGHLDQKMRSSPSITTPAIEASVMYSVNKTQDWLQNKNDSDKITIITNARLERKSISENEKKIKQQLEEDRNGIINERIKAKKESEERKQEKKNEILKNIAEIGIWQNIHEINSELALLKTKKDKILALKKQINMHKDNIKVQNDNKHIFQFSSKGKQHDVDQLTKNLLKILQLRNSSDMDIFQEPESFIGKIIIHTWTDELTGIDTKYKGKIMAYSNEIYKVRYFDGENLNEDTFELTTAEFKSDYRDGNLCFSE